MHDRKNFGLPVVLCFYRARLGKKPANIGRALNEAARRLRERYRVELALFEQPIERFALIYIVNPDPRRCGDRNVLPSPAEPMNILRAYPVLVV